MTTRPSSLPAYAELSCLSNFSFLRGASGPEELVSRAKQLGYDALTIADECSMAGAVRAHVAAKQHDLKLLVGSQFLVSCDSPFTLVVIACDLDGYGNLCEFITKLRRSAPKGTYNLTIDDIDPEELCGCVVVASPERSSRWSSSRRFRDGCCPSSCPWRREIFVRRAHHGKLRCGARRAAKTRPRCRTASNWCTS